MKIIDLAISLVGLISTLAYDNLSYNKNASQSRTFPGPWYSAENAVDGNTATCMRTQEISINSPDKTVWWKVDLGGVYNIYSVNILFKNYEGHESRQQGRFAGFSLYISNSGDIESSSLCYKDGPELPPLNFSTECTSSGRYVIFYNERLDGVTYPAGYEVYSSIYTELCEVTVNGCRKPAVYGINCHIPCPSNCRYKTCHIKNGTCFGCVSGYQGPFCKTECSDGAYGYGCVNNCSGHCVNDSPCNKQTGHCDRGCDPGYTNAACSKECSDGAYGYGCVNNCSGHCVNDSPCNKQTGHCDRGCVPGYTNAVCSKECSSGTYGKNCTKKCSEYCLHNKPCDHIDGACTDGCQDGYIGNICNTSCENGRYGKNCSRTCSSNCKVCKHTDGTCSCYAGWRGPNCSIECTNSYGENCQNLCHPFCVNQTCDQFDGDLEILEGSNQKEETWRAGLSVSIGFNALLLAVILFLLWRHYTKVHSGAIKSCWESSLYEKSTHTDVPEPTYQELDVKDNPYQNTTIN